MLNPELDMPAVRSSPAAAAARFDVEAVRADFPILHRKIHGRPLVYLDNAATTQKPAAVLDAIDHYYRHTNANIHRAVHQLSQAATQAYERARQSIARFINAPDARQCIFTRGTTEGINLVASTWGRANLLAGDEVIITGMEHHSNIVPWQIACEAAGATLKVIPVTDEGELDLHAYAKLLSKRTKLVAVTHLSNALGTINDVGRIGRMAHDAGAKILVDGAQWVSHFPTDVQALDVDFYAFSGHKLFGPTGIGILYGRRELLEAMPPYQGGGDMIESVTFEKTTYAPLPNKFEAGTPDIAGAVGLGAAVEYLEEIGMAAASRHESELLAYATERISAIPGIRIIGTAQRKASVVSFVIVDPPVASLDVGTKLDLLGIAVRTGHHCCQPLMQRFCIPSTARASFAFYNTRADVDALADGLERIIGEARSRVHPVPTEPARPADDVEYPDAVAPSPKAAAEELAESLEMLGEWQDRYQYIMELGEQLPPMPESLKTEGNRVHGCQSTVHLAARRKPGQPDVLQFLADSDAQIVRGLIALLQRICSGQRAKSVLAFDVTGFFSRIGLDRNLSMTRRNGLAGMVERIKALAGEMASGSDGATERRSDEGGRGTKGSAPRNSEPRH